MHTPTHDDITTKEALDILGYSDRSSIVGMVRKGRLVPSRQLPGDTGAYLFHRADIMALAEKLAVERQARHERDAKLDAKLAAAKAQVPS